ncbi:hypothetical protein QP157_13810 [Sphingomonas sp. LR61]|uniref:hypothetical protein n=1 Tax=Sphingomonas sp. LR61 TaxID=3050234 RepID=UPI002FE17BBE
MRAWQAPSVPDVPGAAPRPVVHDTATGKPVDPTQGDERAALYVCGITPYDATHLGHAATYLAFDTLGRAWRDAGLDVEYAQNVTDVDDPLLERATRDGVDWRELAASQIDLFRRDMESLRILPPDDFVAVTDEVDRVAEAVAFLQETGSAYEVPTPDAEGEDLYFDVNHPTDAWSLGDESGLDRETMLTLAAERGGDPERPGKRDPLDPLLWRAARDGEPSWDSEIGPGRPGWHIECSVIAGDRLGLPISVQGGGSDLVFPHHEMSAGHAAALAHQPLAHAFVHTGMIAYQGTKISKSLGNLVTVRGLLDDGADPARSGSRCCRTSTPTTGSGSTPSSRVPRRASRPGTPGHRVRPPGTPTTRPTWRPGSGRGSPTTSTRRVRSPRSTLRSPGAQRARRSSPT